MSWLYRLFKRNEDETLITLDSSVTSGITVPALTVTGKTTQTGVETFTAAPVFSTTSTFTGAATFVARPISTGVATASPTLYKVATFGGVDLLVGATPGKGTPGSQVVVPTHIGDMMICTSTLGNQDTGKMWIAAGITASTDWKLITSA